MRHLPIAVFVLFAAFTNAQPMTQITGVVTTPEGSPLPGVTISAQNSELKRTAVTDSNGKYVISLPAGTYAVQATLEGFSVQTRKVDVVPGRAQNLDFTFGVPVGTPITGTIKGRVADAKENVLANATVTISNGSATYTVKTDSDGYYSRSSLTPGPYTITASKAGYKTQQKKRTLGDNQTLVVDFDLQKQ